MFEKKKINPKANYQRWEWIRTGIQLLFFVFAPSIYNVCFSSVKQVFSFIGRGEPLEYNGFVIQLLSVIVITILFGRIFCGWACAFGAVNDWIYHIFSYLTRRFKKIKQPTKNMPTLPKQWIRIAECTKYLILFALLGLCFHQQEKWITPNSPWTVFSLFRAGKLPGKEHIIGLFLFILLIIGMCFCERFFCRFFCPMGAIFALLPQVSVFRLKRNAANCPSKCGACKKVCPMDYQIEKDSVRMGECIRCERCRQICPRKNIQL